MTVKMKEIYDRTRHVKIIDKSRKYVLRGEKNARHHDRLLFNKKKPYNSSWLITLILVIVT